MRKQYWNMMSVAVLAALLVAGAALAQTPDITSFDVTGGVT